MLSRLPKYRPRFSWFWLGLVLLFLFSAGLRFWGLTRFNTLVFDEVYSARYGQDYLTHTPLFDVHPPLGKYMISLGIWLSHWVPFGQNVQTTVDDFSLPTFSYRWFNALTGACIPPVAAAIAYQLTDRRRYALLAGLMTAMDGLLLVESRYALINIYLVLFGLLGHLFLLLALNRPPRRQFLWLGLSGLFLGAAISVKWNGLGFLLGIYLLWGGLWLWRLTVAKPRRDRAAQTPLPENHWPLSEDIVPGDTTSPEWLSTELLMPSVSAPAAPDPSVFSGPAVSAAATATPSPATAPIPTVELQPSRSPLSRLTRLGIGQMALFLGLIPSLVYYLNWLPHLAINTDKNFWQLHHEIFRFHAQLGSGPQEHPYCSSWLSWMWMLRPVGYFYQSADVTADAATGQVLAAPTLNGMPVIYDVHGMGNPVLWWLGAIAILMLAGLTLFWLFLQVAAALEMVKFQPQWDHWAIWTEAYLVVNYCANYLPWAKVSRCVFIYHYMPASAFVFMSLALVVSYTLRRDRLQWLPFGIGIGLAVVLAFWFWLPLFLGLPLSEEAFHARMWLESWY